MIPMKDGKAIGSADDAETPPDRSGPVSYVKPWEEPPEGAEPIDLDAEPGGDKVLNLGVGDKLPALIRGCTWQVVALQPPIKGHPGRLLIEPVHRGKRRKKNGERRKSRKES